MWGGSKSFVGLGSILGVTGWPEKVHRSRDTEQVTLVLIIKRALKVSVLDTYVI